MESSPKDSHFGAAMPAADIMSGKDYNGANVLGKMYEEMRPIAQILDGGAPKEREAASIKLIEKDVREMIETGQLSVSEAQ